MNLRLPFARAVALVFLYSINISAFAQSSLENYAVVVNASIELNRLSVQEVQKVLLGEDGRFTVVALQRPNESHLVKIFAKTNISAFKKNWSKLSSGDNPFREPVYSRSARSILKFVERTNGALAIVDRKELQEQSGIVLLELYNNPVFTKAPPLKSERVKSLPVTHPPIGNKESDDKRGLERLYQAALTAENTGEVLQAKLLFEELQRRQAGFRDVHETLHRLDSTVPPKEEFTQTVKVLEEQPGEEPKSQTEEDVPAVEREKMPAFSVAQKIRPSDEPLETPSFEDDAVTFLEETKFPVLGEGSNYEAFEFTEITKKSGDLDLLYQRASLALQNKNLGLAEKILIELKTLAVANSAAAEMVTKIEKEMLLVKRDNELSVRSGKNLAPQEVDYENIDYAGAEVPGAGSRVFALTICSILTLPILALVFSPGVRAETLLLLGITTRAMRIYEKLLTKHPEKLKLYLKLADIYLLLGRQDEGALKVFTKVLKLRLATPNLGQIRSVIARNNYYGKKK